MIRTLLVSYEDFISAYDPAYTQDIDSWRLCFTEFMHFIRELILSNPTRQNINFLHGCYADVMYSIKAYERHAGVNLFPTRLWGRSMLHSLYSGDTLT